MRIAFIQNKLGRTDGVSLEVDKWRCVFERMGHEVFYIAGNDEVDRNIVIEELDLKHPLINKILKNATIKFVDYKSEKELKSDITAAAAVIKHKLSALIKDYKIDIIIPNNLLSIGYNIPALLALSEIIAETEIPTIAHCHDFYFEPSGEVAPTCQTVWDILDEHAPPRNGDVQVVVINSIACQQLKRRKGIEATVVPNVFDFSGNAWGQDSYNCDFRKSVGIDENDLVFLQATRILDRKGVELAIDLVAAMNKNGNIRKLTEKPLYNGKRFSAADKVVLVCSGYVEDFGISSDYYRSLLEKAETLGVDIRFIGDQVAHTRKIIDGKKIYSLWDSYQIADFVTYPSLWEGWGNQLIEAVYAKLPVVVFEYPVFLHDLAHLEFNFVSLGSKIKGYDSRKLAGIDVENVDAACCEIIDLLHDNQKRSNVVEHNYQTAKNNFSFENLEAIINDLIGKVSVRI